MKLVERIAIVQLTTILITTGFIPRLLGNLT